MVELKIKDAESAGNIVAALKKNGYYCKTFINWVNYTIDYITIQIEVKTNDSNSATVFEILDSKASGGI